MMVGLSKRNALCLSKMIADINQITTGLSSIQLPSVVGDATKIVALVSLPHV